MKLYLPKELFDSAEDLMSEPSKGDAYVYMTDKQKEVAQYAQKQGILIQMDEYDPRVYDKDCESLDESDKYDIFSIPEDTELVEYKKMEIVDSEVTLSYISDLMDLIATGQIDESTLHIQCDNDSTCFTCSDERYAEFFEDPEDEPYFFIRIKSTGGYRDVVELYDLLFPKADVFHV